MSLTRQTKPRKDWTLSALPPAGDVDVGPVFYELFDVAREDRDRRGLPERWLENHRLFRGQHWPNEKMVGRGRQHRVTVNLLGANVLRTVSNITSKEPEAEVVEVNSPDAPFTPGGVASDELTKGITTLMRQWYNESEQGRSLARSVLNMEVYGITVEKTVWTGERAETVVVDPFAFFPAPGYVDELNDLPYVAHAYAMRCDEIEGLFGQKPGTVEADDVYSLLGEEREDHRPTPAGTSTGSTNHPSNYAATNHPGEMTPDQREKRALVCEVWVHDHSTRSETQTVGVDLETGEPLTEVIEVPNFPDGIRVVTVTNYGNLVLADRGNPNLNPNLPPEALPSSYLYGRIPFSHANSYEDSTSIWGFSVAEQTSDLALKINELVSRIANYLGRLMLPTLILPKDTGITPDMLNNKPGLVLQPISSMSAAQIRYLSPPNLPGNFFDLLNMFLSFFDRISMIESVDQGRPAGGVIAASGIQMLQSRNDALIRNKIRSVDYLVRERGRCALSFLANFSLVEHAMELGGETVLMRGVDLAGKRFNYVVESGSTVHRTSDQIQEQAERLYQVGAIDREALLDAINFPRWQEVVERVGEGQLQQALQILQQAGLPEEEAAELYNFLMQNQTAAGGVAKRDNGGGANNSPNQSTQAKAKQGKPQSEQKGGS